jgi:hypothetical protein
MLSEAIQVKSEEESSKQSDKSYCVDALLSFEDDGGHRKVEDFHYSHDSEVTALVSNTAAAAVAAREAAGNAVAVAVAVAGEKDGAAVSASPEPESEQGTETAIAELALLLEQATSLTSRRRVRSNSFDSTRPSSSYFSSDRMNAMYSSAPNLDFFNAFDQDPHLSDTETHDHKGSWWDDSEHTSKIIASFNKDFDKMHSTFASRRNDKFAAKSIARKKIHTPQESGMNEQESSTPEPPHQEFWFDETESSSERLSHSLHSIRKSADQRKVKSDGTVKTDFTDMAVALPCTSLSNLKTKPGSKEGESDTVATSPATPTVTSRDSAMSSSNESTRDTNVAVASPVTSKVAVSVKSPNTSPKRSPKVATRLGGSELKTPIVSNKKKKVIKVRAGGFDGEMDPAKVQEAVKKWKAAKQQFTSTAADEAVGNLEHSTRSRGGSKSPSERQGAVRKRDGVEPSSGDASSRSRRSRTTREVGGNSHSPSVRRENMNDKPETQVTPKRGISKGRPNKGKEEESVAQNLRPRSKSSSPPESSSKQSENIGLSAHATPRRRSQSKAQQTPEMLPGVPLTPNHTPKQLVRKAPPSDASAVVQKPLPNSSQTPMATSTRRGRLRPADPASPMKTLRSLSIGRGNKASCGIVARGGSTRSTFTAILDGEPSRARSRSLGKIGNALFRRKFSDGDTVSESRNAKDGTAPGGLFASFTNVVSRSSRPKAAAMADANVDARSTSARSKSLPRVRQMAEQRERGCGPGVPQTSKPLTAASGSGSGSSSLPRSSSKAPTTPRRSMKNVSTRAICAGSAVRSPTPASPTTPRRQRPIPPQDYIPASIDLSPSSSGVDPVSRTSSMDNNEPCSVVTAGVAPFPGLFDRRQLLERTVSDLSDDALFRRIESAGVTEEMMGKLREAGLIITEAPPPATVSLSSSRPA